MENEDGKFSPMEMEGVLGIKGKPFRKTFHKESQLHAFQKKHEGNYEAHRYRDLEEHEIAQNLRNSGKGSQDPIYRDSKKNK